MFKRISLMFVAATLALGLGAADSKRPAGTVTALSGKVSLFSDGAKTGKALKLGRVLYAGDRLTTGPNGKATLALTDGTIFKINYSSDVTLRDKDSKGQASERGIASIKIALGQFWAKITKKNSKMEFETPNAVAAVKGTELGGDLEADGDVHFYVKEGVVMVCAGKECEDVKAGQAVGTDGGQLGKVGNAGKGDGDWSKDNSAAELEVKALVRDSEGNEKEVILNYQKK